MTVPPLFLVKVPLRTEKIIALAKRRQIALRHLDDGYVTHCLLAELWQDRAPGPFFLKGNGRVTDVWGYTNYDAASLISHARDFADPTLLDALDGLEAIVSRPMPRFEAGKRVGFLTRVCPVARLSKATHGHRPGAEVDVFLAKSFAAGPDVPLSREQVYREWFTGKFEDVEGSGASVASVRVAGMARRRLIRRTQGADRKAQALDRPDVHLEGELTIEDGDAFLRLLAHGVGRHRSFGFGAILVVPPGTAHDQN